MTRAREARAPGFEALAGGDEPKVVEAAEGCHLTWLKLVRTAVVDAGEGIAEVVG
ncbi:hypothetical protein KIPE111705_27875 [Kibdelosporangium persicum]